MKKTILFLCLMSTLIMSALCFNTAKISASAEANTAYSTLYASYEWSSFSPPSTNTSGTQSADRIYWNDSDLAILYMYPSSYSGSSTLHSDCILNWNEVNIFSDIVYETESTNFYYSKSLMLNKDGIQYYYKTWSSSERTSKLLFSGNLQEGNYTFIYVGVYTETAIAVTTFTYTFNFVIHKTPPEYTLKFGDDTVLETGLYTNKNITFSSLSPIIKGIYLKQPQSSTYALSSDSNTTIANTSPNGWYYFYVEDLAGNKSQTISVYLDTTAPEGTLYENGSLVSNEHSTNLSFNYLATDSGSGVDYLEYKPPNLSSWQPYTFGMVIPQSSSIGQYSFRAIDKCGNISNISTIHLTSEHEYNSEIIPPTCDKNGYTKHTCSHCGDYYDTDFVLPRGHTYNSYVTKQATCLDEGERYFTCEYCNEEHSETIPPLGHNYIISSVMKDNDTTKRVWTCTLCQDSYTEDLGNQYEVVTSYIELLFNKYTPYMIWAFLATSGVWSIFIGIYIIIAQKNEEKEKAKKMLVNYVIGLVAIFSILVAAPFLIRGIASLIT